MKILYLGSGEFGIASLNSLIKSKHDVGLIVTAVPKQSGRGKKIMPTPVACWAREHSVDLIEAESANAIIDEISRYRPDLILVIAFGQKIGSELINLPPKGAINVHGSLLPKYRGAAPINWAIINGEQETGVSIITLADKIDSGQILAAAKTEIGNDETAGELHDRLAKIAAPLLIETLGEIEGGTAVYTEQDHSSATLAPKLKKSDGFIDFDQCASVIERQIRGFWPWPETAALYRSAKTGKSQRVILASARVVEAESSCEVEAGRLDRNLNVVCKEGALKIIRIKPAGGKLMNFMDFVNGRHVCAGDKLHRIEK